MDTFFLAMLVALGAFTLKVRDEKRRMALLGSHLGHFQIEKLMAHLAQGYMRALDEKDPARREQIWQLLEGTETSLSDQFGRFTQEFSRVSPEQARVCKVAVPYIDRWLPGFEQDQRSYLTVAVGCTGGQHRSVYVAEALTRHFRALRPTLLRHRELDARDPAGH